MCKRQESAWVISIQRRICLRWVCLLAGSWGAISFLLLSGLSGICGISCIFASYNSKQQNLKMKNLRVLVVFVLIMHTMVSCRESHREDKEIAGRLEALWNLSECHPDSAAIAFMDFGDSVKHCSEYTRELYNLLCIRIREKRNMTATAVDSVKSIAEYMERHRWSIWARGCCISQVVENTRNL